ncbi:glycosyltransferase family 2 protein [Marinococcus sp. PL1-022]|uniref:glycosyltransferase family 2 protein n=1 Tax=Marinococcus sp. PL1-022 TaxID=3095363 RepID=UPI0029C20E98|nr:glycosyltransferase family 2 protein [Marinococcus sp. PL1-022]MDX6151589.1 glycosyltransferase family 2 protein [Marinococcus sp. PL1-022]
MKKISIVIPSFNEEDNIVSVYESLQNHLGHLPYEIEALYIDDGSSDRTLTKMRELAGLHENVSYVSFTRNFGKEAALIAGLHHADGDAVVIIDADLQHPSEVILELIEGYEEGYDQVIAKRNREGDSKFRSGMAAMYYKFINRMVDVKLEDGVGDFRLLSRRALDALLSLSEANRFSKGLFSWIGFPAKTVYYENVQRQEGETKWSFSSLLNYGVDGMISFNNRPLRLCLYTGLIVMLLALVYIGITFVQIVRMGIEVPGYFTTISAILFLGGVQLLSLGVLGEYIGRIYYETKRRPHYLVQESNTKRRDA